MTRSHIRSRTPSSSVWCIHCLYPVPNRAQGTRHRNHCPHCLWSRHMDLHPGDRRCLCRGAMEPISIWFRSDGEGAIIHRCTRCGELSSNRLAGDDNPAALCRLANQIADKTETITRGRTP
jgi:hypothetical protein